MKCPPLWVLALAFVSGAFVSSLQACGGNGGDGGASSLDDDAGVVKAPDAPAPLEGLASVSITPASAKLTIVPGATAKATFVATGTFDDGSTRDVTSSVVWSTSSSSASIDHGALATTAPGSLTISASSGKTSANATVTVIVSGDLILPGFDPSSKASLDGSPTAGASPSVAYPLAGALFPVNLAPIDVQLKKGAASQSLARIAIKVDGLVDLRIYAPCGAIASAADGCSVLLGQDVVTMLAGASEVAPLTGTVRLGDASGGPLGETALPDIGFTNTRLSGGLYYWTANGVDGPDATAISRFDLDHLDTPPVAYFTQTDSPPLPTGEKHPCVGCHAISHDGKKIALTFGGSEDAVFQLLDVTGKSPIATRNSAPFATFTTFDPAGDRVVNGLRGKLMLRSADASLSELGTLFEDVTTELKTEPFWSPDGTSLAFVSWQPNANGAGKSDIGDLVQGGQIWISPSDGKQMSGKPRIVVPRQPNKTSFYPAISDDGALVVYNESSCDGPASSDPYGEKACDGYDDVSARVKIVGTGGGATVDLGKLNGGDDWTNSWPRFSPGHGTYRGKTIYWIAFSSKRPYGLRIAGSATGDAKPQLWFAAVQIETGKPLSVDPSFAPVWLPQQNSDVTKPAGNHVPQWTVTAVPVR